MNAIPARPEPARLIDLAAYRRARSARIRPPRPDFEDDDDEDDWEASIHGVIDTAEELLAAGRRDDVVEFCSLAADCLGHNRSELGNPRALLGLTIRLGDLRDRAGGAR